MEDSTATAANAAEQSTTKIVQLTMPDPDVLASLPLSQRTLLPCVPGQIIGEVLEILPDSPLPPFAITLDSLQLGPNVQWDPSNKRLLATTHGHILLSRRQISVSDSFESHQSIDASGGPIQFTGNMVLHKDLCDLVQLQLVGNLSIHGTIEAAQLYVNGNIHVGHGICGKERGHVRAIGNIHARFASNARITAFGTVEIENEVTNSHIACDGEFKSKNGSIHGGFICSRCKLTCETAGSPAGVRTILEVGLAPESLDEAKHALIQLETLHQRAQAIRATLAPLMKNQKGLTAAQKEKATELLFSADEMDQHAREIITLIHKVQAELRQSAGGQIFISHNLHIGVVLRFPGAEATAPHLHGPIRVTLSEGPDSQVVITETSSGRITRLPTTHPDTDNAKTIAVLLRHKHATAV